MSPVFDPLNIILLAIAVIVFWRFRSVLGQRTGAERPPLDPAVFKPRPKQATEPVPAREEIDLEAEPAKPVWHGYAEEGSDVAQGLSAIAKAMPDFNPDKFITGAKRAYEMILEAYALGNRNVLKPLLGPDVLESFLAAIDGRERDGAKSVFKFVGTSAADFVRTRMDGRKAQVTIHFVSDLILATTARDGTVRDGDPVKIRSVDDTWTFERDTSTRDPNWKLVSTDDDVG